LPSYFDPTILGVIASLVTIVLLSRRGEVSEAEVSYRAKLHVTPAQERDWGKLRVTLVAPLLLVLYGVLMPFALLYWYVEPYQRGAGELLPGGAFNWLGAEALFAWTPAVLFIPLGLVSTWVIWRRYRPLPA